MSNGQQPVGTAPLTPVESPQDVMKRISEEISTVETKNSIVATSGLDSWNEVKDDSTFKTLSTKQKIEYAK